jgi:hypothetical protein
MKDKPSIEDLRNYGLPNSELTSTPVATPAPDKVNEQGCPNCGCKQMMEINVEAKQNLLKGGKGTGTYLGCPACPYASPMLIISDMKRG